jgi:hypothetical protein
MQQAFKPTEELTQFMVRAKRAEKILKRRQRAMQNLH